jgi:hypothetical protein
MEISAAEEAYEQEGETVLAEGGCPQNSLKKGAITTIYDHIVPTSRYKLNQSRVNMYSRCN